ncbi:type II toxin-antitoxin system RelE/ParE family toxin [Bradyrhizobium sp. HKCCYLS20291]|uniref:type II toxin-antitoxin system RelE/ParE family toxin n=1 Tax=Bradyrhizobium sp. HKCCYLS20291 TaxID=3420766 RepID=UPI003EB8A5B6
MSQRQIRWTRRALQRLDEIGSYIAKDNPGAAARVVARIVLRVESLAARPEMGRPGRVTGTRELVLADVPYIVPYRLTQSGIEVLTVMHTAQKWPDKL